MKRPVFGSIISASSRLKRSQKERNITIHKPVTGIYIGYRTTSDGSTYYSEDGIEYCPSNFYEIWLIVPGPRNKPVMVLPETVEQFNGT